MFRVLKFPEPKKFTKQVIFWGKQAFKYLAAVKFTNFTVQKKIILKITQKSGLSGEIR